MTDNRHPEQLLAGYVDGSITDRERLAVESHLAACARCREESALAMRGLSALRDLPEEPVPFGVMNPVAAEIARQTSRPRARPLSQRVLWAAGGAVAAAFIGLLAVGVLPNLGGGADDLASGGGGPEAAPANDGRAASTTAGEGLAGGGAVTLEHTSTNYDDEALQSLARSMAHGAAAGTLRASDASEPESQPAETASATECLARGASVESQEVLVRLISGRYEDEPALIGVYLSRPAPGQRADEVVVWVVRANTCEFASITSKRI